MNETTINALMTIFMVAIFAVITVVMVVGGVYLIWGMVTDIMDDIREREEKETE